MRRIALLLTLPCLLAAGPSPQGAESGAHATEKAPARPGHAAAETAAAARATETRATETGAAGTQVLLAARPGTPLDAEARRLEAHDIAAGRAAGEAPLVLIGSAPLGAATDRPALFVQLQSARECGSAGCSTTVYLWQGGEWRRVLDGVGGKLTVAAARTRGMANLVSESTHYVWSGHEYRDAMPGPALDLRDLRRRR